VTSKPERIKDSEQGPMVWPRRQSYTMSPIGVVESRILSFQGLTILFAVKAFLVGSDFRGDVILDVPSERRWVLT